MSTAITEIGKKYCTSCGTQHEREDRFCSGCGRNVVEPVSNRKANWKWSIQVALVVFGALVLLKAFDHEKGIQSEAAPSAQSRFDGQKNVRTFVDSKRMWDFSVKAPDPELVQQMRFDEYIAQAVTHAEHNRAVASRLRELDTVGVDPDISTFVLEAAEMFDIFAGFSDQKRVFVERLKEHVDEFASFRGIFEAFARGFIGDPFGKSREALRGQERLKAMWEEARAMEEKLKEIAVLIDQKDARLQLYLQTVYGANLSK